MTQGLPVDKPLNLVYLLKDRENLVFTNLPTTQMQVIQVIPYEAREKKNSFFISFPVKILEGPFHKLGLVKAIHGDTSDSVTISFQLERFDAKAITGIKKSHRLYYFCCNECLACINKTPLSIKELPTENWREMIDCWSCHASEFSNLLILSESNTAIPKKDVVLAGRFYYTFHPNFFADPICPHLPKSENKISIFDLTFANETQYQRREDQLEAKLARVLVEIIFYESIYTFKVLSKSSRKEMAFQVLNPNIFKLFITDSGEEYKGALSLKIIKDDEKYTTEFPPMGHIHLSDTAYDHISTLLLQRQNYLIKNHFL